MQHAVTTVPQPTLEVPPAPAGGPADALADPLAAASLAMRPPARDPLTDPLTRPPAEDGAEGPGGETDRALTEQQQRLPGAAPITAEAPPRATPLAPQADTAPIMAPVERPAAATPVDAVHRDVGAPPAPQRTFAPWTHRQPDELIDPYMESNWDDTDYISKATEIGALPDAMGTELDQWMTAEFLGQADDKTRRSVNFAVGIGAGVFDALALSTAKSIPVLGVFAHLASGARNLWADGEALIKGDSDVVFAMMMGARELLDILGSSVGNISDTFSIITDVMALLATPTAGITAVVGVVTEIIGRVFDLIGAPIDGLKMVLSSASLLYSVAAADMAESAGLYGSAKKYRGLALDSAMKVLIDGIAVGLDLFGLLGINMVPGEIGENLIEDATKRVAEGGVKGLFKLVGKDGAKVALKGIAGGLGEAFGFDWGGTDGGVSAVSDIMNALGVGDGLSTSIDGDGLYAMSVDGLDGVMGLDADDELLGAWTKTSARMKDVRGLAKDDPKWSQAVINTIMGPEEITPLSVIDMVLRPSQAIGGIAYLWRKGVVMTSDPINVVNGLQGLASMVDRVGEPILDWATGSVEGLLDQAADAADGFEARIEEQEISLDAARKGYHGTMDVLKLLTHAMDEGGGIDKQIDTMQAQLAGAKAIKIDLPWPLDGLEPKVEGSLHGVVDQISGTLGEMGSTVREQLDGALEGVHDQVEAQTEVLAKAIEEGGSVEAQLETARDQVAGMVDELEQGMRTVDLSGISLGAAVKWLRDKAKAVDDVDTMHDRTRKWHDHVGGEAQAEVHDWRGKWGDEVTYAFRWHVQDYEIDAATAVKGEVDAGLQRLRGATADPKKLEAIGDLERKARGAWGMIDFWKDKDSMPLVFQRIAMKRFWQGARELGTVHASMKELSA